MPDRSQGRRTVLGTLVGIALASILGPAAGARNGREPPDDGSPPHSGGGRFPPRRAGAGSPLGNRADASLGVVDRIVDGRFVVILVEDEDDVVDQTVLGIDDPILPDVAEGDVLLLGFDEDDLVALWRLETETERRKRRDRDRFDDIAESIGFSGWRSGGVSSRRPPTGRSRRGPSRPSPGSPGDSERARPR